MLQALSRYYFSSRKRFPQTILHDIIVFNHKTLKHVTTIDHTLPLRMTDIINKDVIRDKPVSKLNKYKMKYSEALLV